MEFPRHVCSREGNTVPLKHSKEKPNHPAVFPLCLPVFSPCEIFLPLCNLPLTLSKTHSSYQRTESPSVFRFLYPVIGLQFVHTHKNSIHGCWVWLPALQIQCVLFHEHEEGEEYCCFSWFHLLCSHVSRLADISVKDRVVKTIT